MEAKRIILMGIMALATITSAYANAPYPAAMDAVYAISDNQGNNANLHKLSDGAGHVRTETTIKNQPTITIIDYTTMTCWTIMETQKIIAKGPYKGSKDDENGGLLQDLGTRTVNGHVCIGKLEAVTGGTKEVWIDKANQIPVRSTFSGGGLVRTSNLTSLSLGAPDASNFQIPTQGYTLITKN